MRNYKYIDSWFAERDIQLSSGFAETLRGYANTYKKANGLRLGDVYALLGCSKQNVSYWEVHCDSTQSRNSVYSVIRKATELFGLNENEAEQLANSAGLSLYFEGGELLKQLGYNGKHCIISKDAAISERMLRHYKKNSFKASAYGDCNSLELQC